MNRKLVLATVFALPAAFATAQEMGYEHVKDLMKANGASLKILSEMAKGNTAFDAEAANAALAKIAGLATKIPAAFETHYEDPKSEAKPEIWQNWDDFAAKSMALETAASTTVDSAAAIGPAMQTIGGACGGCHKAYRIDK